MGYAISAVDCDEQNIFEGLIALGGEVALPERWSAKTDDLEPLIFDKSFENKRLDIQIEADWCWE